MVKKKITLTVEEHLVNIAKDSGLNISKFLDEKLAEKYGIKKEIVWVTG